MQTQKLILTPAELEDFQNFGTQNIPRPTSTELAIADAIIAEAWKLAEESGHQSPEKIWSELDSIRTKIANRDAITP
ncbi:MULTISPECIES: hypothetical protein [unclassified Spirulina]|uniref:hypothetical protein n=1 Tax=unclassified Spirulina TaxID=2684457 RepID=UPI00194E7FA6|nr:MULTISPECIES: hypothetical protein [Spirulina]MEA5471543.1 hypothetical protein [Spirulina sp. 06S082]